MTFLCVVFVDVRSTRCPLGPSAAGQHERNKTSMASSQISFGHMRKETCRLVCVMISILVSPSYLSIAVLCQRNDVAVRCGKLHNDGAGIVPLHCLQLLLDRIDVLVYLSIVSSIWLRLVISKISPR